VLVMRTGSGLGFQSHFHRHLEVARGALDQRRPYRAAGGLKA
jgi:hypothetical protein